MRGFVDGEYQDGELRGITYCGGQRGMGKTTEVERLLSACAGGALLFDSLSKHSFRGWKIVRQPWQLVDYLRLNRRRRFRILYQPSPSADARWDGNLAKGQTEPMPIDHFRKVCKVVRAFGWMVFGIDELDMHCDAIFGRSRMPPELNWLVQYGRHERISMIATSRYPNQVSRDFLSQWEYFRLFRMQDEDHVRRMKKLCVTLPVAQLAALEPYQFLLCKQGQAGAELRGGRR